MSNEMMNLILRKIAESLTSGSSGLIRFASQSSNAQRRVQDYDVVYIVDDLEDLISDLSWLDQYGNRLIEQHNRLGHRHLYLMLLKMGIVLI